MSQDLENARQLITAGSYRRAVTMLWRVEANARTDFDEARGLLELATACRFQTDGRLNRRCELLIRYATNAIERLSRESIRTATPDRPQQAEPRVPPQLAACPPMPRRTSIAVHRGTLGGFELIVANALVACIRPAGRDGSASFERADAASAGDRWRLVRGHYDHSWRGVAESFDTNDAVAASYPGWLPGGEVALRHQSCHLEFHPLTGVWRLRYDGNRALATAHVTRPNAASCGSWRYERIPRFASSMTS
jgi:hypothetical protein